MIKEISPAEIPISAPRRKARPNPAGPFAKDAMCAFLASGFPAAEVTEVPAALNTTKLYEALRNEAFMQTMRDRARTNVRVMRRGGHIYLWRINR